LTLASDSEFLNRYGWSEFFASALSRSAFSHLRLARVVCEERKLYQLQVNLNEDTWGAISGKMIRDASARPDYPAVGDWVLIEEPEGNERAIIHEVLPRRTVLVRKQVGESADVQILSSNVDYVFVTSSLNEDLNFRRIERFLTVAREGGATPIVLLTKADLLGEDAVEFVEEARIEFAGTPVYSLSQDELAQATVFAELLKTGTTSVFLGSSGVGKSTIVNYLIGAATIEVQEVREKDGKGRHTTTSRNMYQSQFGGMIIDTPGMREVQLSDHGEGVSEQFADVEDIILKCRFTNCKHAEEPGCAVRGSLASGALTEDRWGSFLKLEAETRARRVKKEKVTAVDEKQAWKKVTLEARKKPHGKRSTR
jgi:ribosome biogenesis GTPase / thiamine phosphate phosphatase